MRGLTLDGPWLLRDGTTGTTCWMVDILKGKRPVARVYGKNATVANLRADVVLAALEKAVVL